jgi:hypothetical protein
MSHHTSTCFQLSFRSLFRSGRGFAFPCDAQGRVNMDALSERARNNYFFARAMVGRDLSTPAVEAIASTMGFAEPAMA